MLPCRLTEERKQQRTKFDYLCMVLPCLSWLHGYNVREHLLVSCDVPYWTEGVLIMLADWSMSGFL
jgi:hypothetical protein